MKAQPAISAMCDNRKWSNINKSKGSKKEARETREAKEQGGEAQDEAGVNVDFKDAKPEQQLQDLSDIFLFEKERDRSIAI